MITLAEAKAFIGIASVNTEYDSQIQTMISAASETVESYCEQPIMPTTEERIVDGSGKYSILLPFSIVRNASDLMTRTAINAAWESVSGSVSIEYVGSSAYLVSDVPFTFGVRNYKVMLGLGFNSTPELCTQVVTEIVSVKFNEMQKALTGVDSTVRNIDGTNIQVKYVDLTNRHKQLLSRYRRLSIG